MRSRAPRLTVYSLVAAFALLLVPDTVFWPPRSILNQPSVLLDKLVAYWKLNELSGTRQLTAGSCRNCALTAVNAPTALGGAGSYGLLTASTGNKHVKNTTATELRLGTGTWAIAAWAAVSSASAGVFVSNYTATTNCSIQLYWNDASLVWNVQPLKASDCSSDGGYASALVGAKGTRHLVVVRQDPAVGTYGTVYTSINAGTESSQARNVAGGTGVGGFSIGNSLNSTTGLDGTIGPVMVWNGTSLDAAARTALYNSGLGYTCASLPVAIRTGLTACYDLNESSGTRYASTNAGASCTTNCDMTAVNAPTSAAGLVQNGMGMSVTPAVTNNSYLITSGATSKLSTATYLEVLGWIYASSFTCPSNQCVVFSKGSLSPAEGIVGPYIQNATTSIQCQVAGTGGATSSQGTMTAGTWMFVGCKFDPIQKKTAAYLNNTWGAYGGTTMTSPADFSYEMSVGSESGPLASSRGFIVGSIDAVGAWQRILTSAEETALYTAGAGVGDPWTQVSEMFQRPVLWADMPIERKQKLVWLKTGVIVPPDMFPSRKVVVVR